MIREILTLIIDHRPTQYYIQFEKDRLRFKFQPTLKNKEAPSFDIWAVEGKLVTEDEIDPALEKQAKEKVMLILTDKLFDKF